MRIISKFKDFYDFAGQQSDIIYVREEKEINLEIPLSSVASFEQWGNNGRDWGNFLILIAAKPYYLAENYRNGNIVKIEELPKKFQYEIHPVPARDTFVKIHKNSKSPIIYTKFQRLGKNNSNNIVYQATCDIKLVNYVKFLPDADVVFREIEFFLSNHLREEMSMPVFSDKEKIEQHGFDKKTSFRGKNR